MLSNGVNSNARKCTAAVKAFSANQDIVSVFYQDILLLLNGFLHRQINRGFIADCGCEFIEFWRTGVTHIQGDDPFTIPVNFALGPDNSARR